MTTYKTEAPRAPITGKEFKRREHAKSIQSRQIRSSQRVAWRLGLQIVRRDPRLSLCAPDGVWSERPWKTLTCHLKLKGPGNCCQGTEMQTEDRERPSVGGQGLGSFLIGNDVPLRSNEPIFLFVCFCFLWSSCYALDFQDLLILNNGMFIIL